MPRMSDCTTMVNRIVTLVRSLQVNLNPGALYCRMRDLADGAAADI